MALGLGTTVDLLFIDTSHLYEDTVRELAAWAPLMSEKGAIILHDTNLSPSRSYLRKDGSLGEGWDNQRGVVRAVQEFANCSFGLGLGFSVYGLGFKFRWLSLLLGLHR
jgi:hypothetical protein